MGRAAAVGADRCPVAAAGDAKVAFLVSWLVVVVAAVPLGVVRRAHRSSLGAGLGVHVGVTSAVLAVDQKRVSAASGSPAGPPASSASRARILRLISSVFSPLSQQA